MYSEEDEEQSQIMEDLEEDARARMRDQKKFERIEREHEKQESRSGLISASMLEELEREDSVPAKKKTPAKKKAPVKRKRPVETQENDVEEPITEEAEAPKEPEKKRARKAPPKKKKAAKKAPDTEMDDEEPAPKKKKARVINHLSGLSTDPLDAKFVDMVVLPQFASEFGGRFFTKELAIFLTNRMKGINELDSDATPDSAIRPDGVRDYLSAIHRMANELTVPFELSTRTDALEIPKMLSEDNKKKSDRDVVDDEDDDDQIEDDSPVPEREFEKYEITAPFINIAYSLAHMEALVTHFGLWDQDKNTPVIPNKDSARHTNADARTEQKDDTVLRDRIFDILDDRYVDLEEKEFCPALWHWMLGMLSQSHSKQVPKYQTESRFSFDTGDDEDKILTFARDRIVSKLVTSSESSERIPKSIKAQSNSGLYWLWRRAEKKGSKDLDVVARIIVRYTELVSDVSCDLLRMMCTWDRYMAQYRTTSSRRTVSETKTVYRHGIGFRSEDTDDEPRASSSSSLTATITRGVLPPNTRERMRRYDPTKISAAKRHELDMEVPQHEVDIVKILKPLVLQLGDDSYDSAVRTTIAPVKRVSPAWSRWFHDLHYGMAQPREASTLCTNYDTSAYESHDYAYSQLVSDVIHRHSRYLVKDRPKLSLKKRPDSQDTQLSQAAPSSLDIDITAGFRGWNLETITHLTALSVTDAIQYVKNRSDLSVRIVERLEERKEKTQAKKLKKKQKEAEETEEDSAKKTKKQKQAIRTDGVRISVDKATLDRHVSEYAKRLLETKVIDADEPSIATRAFNKGLKTYLNNKNILEPKNGDVFWRWPDREKNGTLPDGIIGTSGSDSKTRRIVIGEK